MNNMKMCFQGQLDTEWWEIEAVFTAIHAAVEEAHATAQKPLKDRRQRLEEEAAGLKKELRREITCFETTVSKLEDLAGHEDHIHFLQVIGNFINTVH